jgi:hypothetical protein
MFLIGDIYVKQEYGRYLHSYAGLLDVRNAVIGIHVCFSFLKYWANRKVSSHISVSIS